MGMSSIGVLIYAMPSLQRCMPCIFVIYVVTSTSMQSSLRDVTDDLVISAKSRVCYVVMPCKPAATSHSMHNLEMFTKYDLFYML